MQLISILAAAEPILATGSGPDISWGRTLGALLFCLLLAVGGAFAMRRHGKGGFGPLFRPASLVRMRLIERLLLGPQTSISLVAIDGREYMVLIAPGSATIRPIDAPDDAPAPPDPIA